MISSIRAIAPLPKVVLAERNRRIFRIGADGTDLHKLLEPGTAGLFDEVQPHRHIGVEVAARVGAIGTDASHLSSQVNDRVWAGIGEELANGLLFGEVVVRAARNDQFAGSGDSELLTEKRAEKTCATGDNNTLVRQ